MNNKTVFEGCSPSPLAFYLKALGLFRIVASQIDNSVRAAWENDSLILSGDFTVESLSEFFLNDYRPPAVVAPWNGGSGFYSSDNQTAKNLIESSDLDRLSAYRKVISAAESATKTLHLTAKPDSETKEKLLKVCRNTFPDEALDWLDAAFVMTDGGPKFPPLLGTGGNDGRLEFTNNFMQRITEVFGLGTKKQADLSPIWLKNALFGTAVPGFAKSPIGQFHPGNAGGANATTGFDGDSLINPWDFILMMEGALLFAGASVKRLNAERGDALAYPFTVRQSGSGYGTASFSDEPESRAEMWMPIWETPTSLVEIEQLFSEGRAEVNGRPAANGVDFTRAVVSLGVDRGITEFQRYGFLVRNGLAYFATPLDRVRVNQNPDADLIAEIDWWLKRFRQKAKQDTPSPPSSMTRALRRIEDGIIRFSKSPEPANAQALFIALGEGEKALNTSVRWAEENFLKPLGGLSARWLELSDDGTPEFRLAASLGSMVSRFGKEWMPLRSHLEPVRSSKTNVFWKPEAHRDVMWHDGEFADVMNRIQQRRMLMENRVGVREVVHLARVVAHPSDIAKFVEKRTDDDRIAKLLWAMILVKFPKEPIQLQSSDESQFAPPSIFALLRSCFPRAGKIAATDGSETPEIPLAPIIHRRAADGQGTEASRLAARRLNASGLRPAVSEIAFENTERVAAAMLFPLSRKKEAKLLKSIQRPSRDRDGRADDNESEPEPITDQTTN